MRRLRLLAFTIGAALVLALGLVAMPPVFHSLNISGYEFLLGTACTINDQAGKCGVEFGGWTGGTGQNADGWTHFPGDRKGLWEATINYIGSPDFDKSVQVYSGTFDVLFKNKKTISGTIENGVVEWPPEEGDDIGCGTNVATVLLNLSSGTNGPTEFLGCLHDLPAGSVIPPKIWGTLQ